MERFLAAAVAAVTFVLGPAPTAQAGPRVVNAHRAATFNTHATALWQSSVYDLTRQAEVVALQEVRDTPPPDAEPQDGARVRRETVRNGYTVQRLRWTACPARETCAIYLLRTHRQNRSLAIVIRQDGDLVDDVDVIPPRGGQLVPADAKPALGVKLSDGTWFYSVHARNRTGASQANDAPALVREVARTSGAHWAALGDFNRTPASMVPEVTADQAEVVSSGNPTFPRYGPTSELDYMVAKGIPTPRAYSGFRLTFTQTSDHFPVGFWESGAASPADRQYPCAPEEGELLRKRAVVCVPDRPAAIVSLGDSYASGEAGRWAGNADTNARGTAWGTDRAAIDCLSETDCAHVPDEVYGPTSYSLTGNRCDRSDVAPVLTAEYPGVDPWQHFDIACSGATTHELTHPYTEKNEKSQTEQLAYIAAHYRVRMITVSIGGNDLGFSDIVRSCARRYLYPSWLPFVEKYCKNVWPDVDKKLATVRQQVVTALRAVQDTMTTAGYRPEDYHLVVQSYPAPLPHGTDYRYPETYARYSDGGCPFYDTDTDWARQTLVGGLTRELRNAAGTVGARFLGLDSAFEGHELCSSRAHQATASNTLADPLPIQDAEWVRWIPYLAFQTLPWTSQGDQQEALHPNAFGQEALGACLSDLGGQLESRLGRPGTDYTCRNDPRQGIVVERTRLPAVPAGRATRRAGPRS